MRILLHQMEGPHRDCLSKRDQTNRQLVHPQTLSDRKLPVFLLLDDHPDHLIHSQERRERDFLAFYDRLKYILGTRGARIIGRTKSSEDEYIRIDVDAHLNCAEYSASQSTRLGNLTLSLTAVMNSSYTWRPGFFSRTTLSSSTEKTPRSLERSP